MRYRCVSLRKNSAPSVTAAEALKVPLSWLVARVLNCLPADNTVVAPPGELMGGELKGTLEQQNCLLAHGLRARFAMGKLLVVSSYTEEMYVRDSVGWR